MLSDFLEISITLNSLKALINEYEVCYWLNHFKKNLSGSSSKYNSSTSVLEKAYSLPVAMVTKLEVSDWIVDFDVDNTTLHPFKGALCQLVIVGGVLKVGLTRNKQMK